jgi:methanogenic corrinoid protein MtbC1
MTDFGTRLKRARKLKNMTQKELAERLSVEQSAISNYETNFRLPAATALMEIANHLDVSVAYLLGGLADIDAFELLANSDLASKKIDLKDVQTEFLDHLTQNNFNAAYERIRNFSHTGIGLLDIYQNVFEPTLREVGYLWETGKISIAEEHIISDLIERAVVAISEDVQRETKPSKNLTAAFMLPGAEMHELPLKMTAEIFKSAGWSVNYIGKSIPIFSIQHFLEKNEIDVLVLSVTLKAHLTSCESLIQLINGMQLSNPPLILIGGSAIENEKVALKRLGADLYLESLEVLNDQLEQLGETLLNLKNA